MDITDYVLAFRRIISDGWTDINNLALLDRTGSYVDDWLQANWERVVEASQHAGQEIYLEPYGDGADCNPGSSRVWMPQAKFHYSVYVSPPVKGNVLDCLNDRLISEPMKFGHFCSMVNGWPHLSTPFDYISLNSPSGESVVALEGMRFFIDKNDRI